MKHISIVGVGALGSHLVQFIRNFEAGIHIIDFDRVEQKNVMSQFHGKMNRGKLKTQSLEASMNFLFGTKIYVNSNRLTLDNDAILLKDSDIIVDCLDNPPTRKIVRDVARKFNIPCLHGALAANGGYGVAVWDKDFIIDEGNEGVATCEAGEHLPFVCIVAANMARALQVFLDSGKQIGYHIQPSGATVLI